MDRIRSIIDSHRGEMRKEKHSSTKPEVSSSKKENSTVELEDLRKEINCKSSQNIKLTKQISVKDSVIKKLGKDLDNIKIDFQKEKIRVNELEDVKNALSIEILQLNSIISDKTEEFTNLQKTFSDLNNDYKKLMKHCVTMDEINMELISTKLTVKNLQQHIIKEEKEKEDLIEVLKTENEKKSQQCDKLTSENAELLKKYKESNEVVKNLEAKVDSMVSEIKNEKNVNSSLLKSLNWLKKLKRSNRKLLKIIKLNFRTIRRYEIKQIKATKEVNNLKLKLKGAANQRSSNVEVIKQNTILKLKNEALSREHEENKNVIIESMEMLKKFKEELFPIEEMKPESVEESLDMIRSCSEVKRKFNKSVMALKINQKNELFAYHFGYMEELRMFWKDFLNIFDTLLRSEERPLKIIHGSLAKMLKTEQEFKNVCKESTDAKNREIIELKEGLDAEVKLCSYLRGENDQLNKDVKLLHVEIGQLAQCIKELRKNIQCLRNKVPKSS